MSEPDIFDLWSPVQDPLPVDAWAAWIYGVFLASALAAGGTYNLATAFSSQIAGVASSDGPTVIPVACFFISFAAFLHFHYFWSNHRRLTYYYEVGQSAAVLAVVASIASGIWKSL